MPANRELSMRQLRHLVRLHHDGVSAREIGRRLGVARSTVQDNLKRASAAGLLVVFEDSLRSRIAARDRLTYDLAATTAEGSSPESPVKNLNAIKDG